MTSISTAKQPTDFAPWSLMVANQEKTKISNTPVRPQRLTVEQRSNLRKEFNEMIEFASEPKKASYTGEIDKTEKTSSSKNSNNTSFFGDDGFGFDDFLDLINPLQHIPIVGQIYRGITGDEISPGARLAGGTLFGGPVGFAAALTNNIIESHTGADIQTHALNTILDNTPPNQPLTTQTSSAPINQTASRTTLQSADNKINSHQPPFPQIAERIEQTALQTTNTSQNTIKILPLDPIIDQANNRPADFSEISDTEIFTNNTLPETNLTLHETINTHAIPRNKSLTEATQQALLKLVSTQPNIQSPPTFPNPSHTLAEKSGYNLNNQIAFTINSHTTPTEPITPQHNPHHTQQNITFPSRVDGTTPLENPFSQFQAQAVPFNISNSPLLDQAVRIATEKAQNSQITTNTSFVDEYSQSTLPTQLKNQDVKNSQPLANTPVTEPTTTTHAIRSYNQSKNTLAHAHSAKTVEKPYEIENAMIKALQKYEALTSNAG